MTRIGQIFTPCTVSSLTTTAVLDGRVCSHLSPEHFFFIHHLLQAEYSASVEHAQAKAALRG